MLRTYYRVLQDSTIAEARMSLNLHSCLGDEVNYHPAGGTTTHLSVAVLMGRFTPCTKLRLIHKVSFVGGPPGQQQWHDGTLLTYLLDRILCKRYLRVTEDGKHLAKI